MKRVINQLKYLKKLNVVAVKQSLEDEGASFDDLKIMRSITKKVGLKLIKNFVNPKKISIE